MFNIWLIGLGIYCILLIVFSIYYLNKRLKGYVYKYREGFNDEKKRKIVQRISLPSQGVIIPIVMSVIGFGIVLVIGSLVIGEVKNSVVNAPSLGLNLAMVDNYSSTAFSFIAITGIIITVFFIIGKFAFEY